MSLNYSLLDKFHSYYERRAHNNNELTTKLVKRVVIISGIFLFCGIVSYALTTFVFHFYKEDKFSKNEVGLDPICKRRIVGYYSEYDSTDISKNQLAKLTHAVFAFVDIKYDGTLQFKNLITEQKFFSLKSKARSLHSNLKLMFSIGGDENSFDFSSALANTQMKSTLITSIIAFIHSHMIDGVDLHWKWPTSRDKSNYATLIREIREKVDELDAKIIISITIPPVGVSDWESGFDLDAIQKHVDFINVHSMDYAKPLPNQWGTPTGPSASMNFNIGLRQHYNVDWTMKHYTCELKKPSMINLVIPFYVRMWKNVQKAIDNRTEVFRNVELKDNEVEGRSQLSRYTVEHEDMELSPESWDNATQTPYVLDLKTRTFFTYENEKSIKVKLDYVNKMDLGGVWIWSVDMDDRLNTLLSFVFPNELCSSYSENGIKYSC
ncbi:GH18 domain-containing protein [Caenorhabditis elegans]|uniref:GH18 domain-containing protein n=1 Tax=Caenorhabditis elegans TaxID=6239 RepID=Q21859_CAEEL|nr:GH18 domain-containing protein [Caenorhabditis elegans]CAA93863.1 GH18 domain-containing protein [Caenorhabditis elegans]|eukprot:NP_496019.1 CHItinase-Like [Caenorhabditis elegans]